MFHPPSFSLTDWFLSLSNLAFLTNVLKISFVLLPVFLHFLFFNTQASLANFNTFNCLKYNTLLYHSSLYSGTGILSYKAVYWQLWIPTCWRNVCCHLQGRS
jgi:hypothetical protein